MAEAAAPAPTLGVGLLYRQRLFQSTFVLHSSTSSRASLPTSQDRRFCFVFKIKLEEEEEDEEKTATVGQWIPKAMVSAVFHSYFFLLI